MPNPLASMTGFARTEGSVGGVSWTWELRSVNGRGLDLRLRLPPGWDALEPALREAASRSLKRGNVTANLSVRRETEPDAAAVIEPKRVPRTEPKLIVDTDALDQALAAALALHARIPGSAPPQAEALLALPGVMRAASTDPAEDRVTAGEPVQAGFRDALAGLVNARNAEGERLRLVLVGLLREIAALREQAAGQAADQPAAQRARMLENVQALLREPVSLPEDRIAQEVALLAARSDIREELDRLSSHVEAAHALLAEAGNIGRRFDFLVQEFNREANTLCSKSASSALTATGLKLKAAIEQLREQVQNIE